MENKKKLYIIEWNHNFQWMKTNNNSKYKKKYKNSVL